MKKPVNHLGNIAEKSANLALPFQQRLAELSKLTQNIQQAWQTLLPDSALMDFMVCNFDAHTLTIRTTSHTIANHLTYSQQPLLQQLHQSMPHLTWVTQLKFIVESLENSYTAPTDKATQTEKTMFSESTRENITQFAELVIDNERLKRLLIDLAKT